MLSDLLPDIQEPVPQENKSSMEGLKHSQLLNLLEPEDQRRILGVDYDEHVKQQTEESAARSKDDHEDEKFVSLMMNDQNTQEEKGSKNEESEKDMMAMYNKHKL